jgi:hypothetical protein
MTAVWTTRTCAVFGQSRLIFGFFTLLSLAGIILDIVITVVLPSYSLADWLSRCTFLLSYAMGIQQDPCMCSFIPVFVCDVLISEISSEIHGHYFL